MEKINKKYINKAASIATSFVLYIVLTCFTLVIGMQTGLFKKSVVISDIYLCDYGDKVLEYIESNCEDIVLSGGVPKEALEGVFDKNVVHHDINKYAEASIEGKEFTVDTSEIADKIRKNIDKYATEQNITLDDSQKEELEVIIKTICDEYVRSVKIPFIDKFYDFSLIFNRIFKIAMSITIPLIIFLVVIIYNLNRFRHRTVRYIIYSITATAISTIVVPGIFLLSGKYKKIGVSPKHFYYLLVTAIEEFLKTYIYIGVLWVIVIVGLFILIRYLKDWQYNNRKVKRKV